MCLTPVPASSSRSRTLWYAGNAIAGTFAEPIVRNIWMSQMYLGAIDVLHFLAALKFLVHIHTYFIHAF